MKIIWKSSYFSVYHVWLSFSKKKILFCAEKWHFTNKIRWKINLKKPVEVSKRIPNWKVVFISFTTFLYIFLLLTGDNFYSSICSLIFYRMQWISFWITVITFALYLTERNRVYVLYLTRVYYFPGHFVPAVYFCTIRTVKESIANQTMCDFNSWRWLKTETISIVETTATLFFR